MNPSVDRVAILCGGRGIRLKPTTDLIPKALVELNGRPILDHVLELYKNKGFARFILCVGYKSDMIQSHYAPPPAGIDIAFSNVGEDASMLQRVWALRDMVAEQLIVSYCDTFIDLDIDDMLSFHSDRTAAATIVTAKIRNPFGLLTCDTENWVTSFVEKPLLNYYIGSFVIKRTTFDHITRDMLDKPDGQGLVELFVSLAEEKKLAAYEHKGPQITFNTESERQEAEQYLGKFYTFTEGR